LQQVRLEHPGHFNREFLDTERGFLGRILLPLLALLDGFRRGWLCFSAMACLFNSAGGKSSQVCEGGPLASVNGCAKVN